MRSAFSLPGLVVLTVFCASNATTAAAQWVDNGVPASISINHMVEPEIAADSFGGALVLWAENSDGVDPIGDLYVQRYHSDGTTAWGNLGALVTTSPGMGIFYRVVPDGEGGAVVAWYDVQGINIFGPVIQRINFFGSKVWGSFPVEITPGAAAKATGTRPTDVPANSGRLDLLPYGGGALVAFEYPGAIDTDIFIQKIDASGTIQWGPNGVAVCAVGASQARPGIISDGEGGAIVAWTDPRNGTDDIYAQRINFLGNTVWTTNGVAVCTAAGKQTDLQMVSDGTSGAIVAWEDQRAASFDIYAQRLNAAGTPQWTADGIAIAALPENQRVPAIVSDDRGGAYIMWTDTRLLSDFEIYGQRVDSGGNVLWGLNGLRMTYGDLKINSLYRPRSARDGNGGVISAYGLRHLSVSGIRAFNADSTGTILWDVTVADTTTNALKQVTVESSSAIIAWEDHRGTGEARVYAQKVPMTVAGVGDISPVLQTLDLSVHPNPISGSDEIRFVLPVESTVQVEVYDVAGRRLNERRYGRMPSGEGSIRLNLRTDSNTTHPSGVYFVRLSAAGRQATSKFIVSR